MGWNKEGLMKDIGLFEEEALDYDIAFPDAKKQQENNRQYQQVIVEPRKINNNTQTQNAKPAKQDIMQDMQNVYKNISRGLELFYNLSLKMYNDLIEESINYDKEIEEINEKVAIAEDYKIRLGKINPKKIEEINAKLRENNPNLADPNIDPVSLKIKTMASTLDSNVNSANNGIYDLIDSDKWTTDVPIVYKNTYKYLINLVLWFYNISIGFKEEYNKVIPKTKDIFGNQLHKKAMLTSATDNSTFDWITNEQFVKGMKSSELKTPKNSNSTEKYIK